MRLFKKAPFSDDRLQKKWTGKRRVIVSLDVGATHTAVAVAILTPGSIPAIVHVSRWPGQEDRMYEEKVPTVVLYDQIGKVVACGADALTRKNEKLADEHGWLLAKNFKLRLHPAAVVPKSGIIIDDLPPNIRLEDVYSDFFSYIIAHTREHLKAEMGTDPWSSDVDIILAHPNKWGKYEQEFLLTALITADVISDSDAAKSRVCFVEEAEASAIFCVSTSSTAIASQLKKGSRFIVCDAGGSTIDTSTYEVRSISSDMGLTELQLPTCMGGGGLHVDQALRQYLSEAFKSVATFDYDSDGVRDLIRDAVRDFQLHGKREFVSYERDVSIQVAGRNVNNVSLGISHGRITLPGETVHSFFSPCVDRMLESLRPELRTPGITHIILTGGLGDSPHVKLRLQDTFQGRYGIVVANSSSSKAVTVGALMLALGGTSRLVNRQDRDFQTRLANFMTASRLETRQQPLSYTMWDMPAENVTHPTPSIPQLSQNRAILELERENLQLATEYTIAPTHDDDDDRITKEIHEIGDPDVLHLITSWETTVSHVHGEEAAELGAKMHKLLDQFSHKPEVYVDILKKLQDLCSLSGELPSSYWRKDVQLDRNDFIGQGGEAYLSRGLLSGQKVVIREFRRSRRFWEERDGQEIMKQIRREVITHSQLDHQNILRLLGVFREYEGGPPMMIIPLAENGSLEDYLRHGQRLTGAGFAKVSIGIARALNYLHSRIVPIIHGDLHWGNILLTGPGEALLCDFGLSRLRHEVTRTLTTIHAGGRQRFLAPELLAGIEEKFRTSKASDVFSEALVFLSAWTGQVPFPEIRSELAAATALREGRRPIRPDHTQEKVPLDVETIEKFWDLVEEMWRHDPGQRPSAQDVERRTEALLQQFTLE